MTSKNITHVRTEEMCLAHYQAAINQYLLSKKQFAEKYIEKALQEISILPSADVQNYKMRGLSILEKMLTLRNYLLITTIFLRNVELWQNQTCLQKR